MADSTDVDHQDEEEEFIYPVAAAPADAPSQPSPAQLESLFVAASSGDLNMLMMLFENAYDSGAQPFSLANDTMPRTGSTVLHTAASRGHIDIVAWRKSVSYNVTSILITIILVVERCGAMPDLEDREGEVCGLIPMSALLIPKIDCPS